MQLIDGQPVFSATDLVGFLACEHLTALERAACAGLVKRPHARRPRARRSSASAGSSTSSATSPSWRRRARGRRAIERDDEDERAATGSGARPPRRCRHAPGDDVIYQATFFDGRWLGHADFLLRVERRAPSAGGRRATRSRTPSSRATSRPAPSSRSARTSTSSRDPGVRPGVMHVALGGSARETAELRVADYMAYYRRPSAASRRCSAATAPAPPPIRRRDLPGARRALRRLPLGRAVRAAPARRRPPLAGGRDHGAPAQGAGARELDTATRPGRPPLPLVPPLDGTQRGSARARPRAGPPPGRGRGLPKPIHELLAPPARGADRAGARAGHRCRSPTRATSSSTSRATPTRSTTASTTCSASSTPDGATSRPLVHAIRTDAERRSPWPPRRRAFERADRPLHRSARARSRPCTSTTTRPTSRPRSSGSWAATATREDEVDRLLRGGVLVDLYRVVRQGAPRVGRELLASSGSSRSTASSGRSACATPARASWPSRSGSSSAEGERPGYAILDEIEAYNRDDVVSHPPPARLARGAAAGARGADRAGRAASRRRSPATRRRPDGGGGPRAGVADALTARRPRRREGAHRPSSRRAGCSPSSCPGIGGRRRRLLGVLPPDGARRRRS